MRVSVPSPLRSYTAGRDEVEARGATLAELFASAAEGLLAASVADPASVGERERLPIDLAEPDLELLLLRFLSELVFLRDARRLLLRPDELRVEANGGARLAGVLVGERIDPARHRLERDVKAVTAYGLRVQGSAGDFHTRVTVDV